MSCFTIVLTESKSYVFHFVSVLESSKWVEFFKTSFKPHNYSLSTFGSLEHIPTKHPWTWEAVLSLVYMRGIPRGKWRGMGDPNFCGDIFPPSNSPQTSLWGIFWERVKCSIDSWLFDLCCHLTLLISFFGHFSPFATSLWCTNWAATVDAASWYARGWLQIGWNGPKCQNWPYRGHHRSNNQESMIKQPLTWPMETTHTAAVLSIFLFYHSQRFPDHRSLKFEFLFSQRE